MGTRLDPIKATHFNQMYRKLKTEKIYAEPLADLPEFLRTLVDVVCNNAILPEAVLPIHMEKHLIEASRKSYSIAYSKANPVVHTKVVIAVVESANYISIYTETDDELVEYRYKTVHRASEADAVDVSLPESKYMIAAARTGRTKTIQYNDDLIVPYKVLFKILYDVSVDTESVGVDYVARQLRTLLKDAEVTVSLSVAQISLVHGSVDRNNIVTLNVREVGTPDTFYTRTVSLDRIL